MKTYLWFLFLFLLVPPVCTFLSSNLSVPHFPSLFSSHLTAVLFIPFPFCSLFYRSLAPLSFLLYLLAPSFSTQSSIYFSPCRSITEPSESMVSQSKAQVRYWNSPPSGAHWHRALLSPDSVGAGQSGRQISLVQAQVSMERPPYIHFISL